jgi:hypothetical protein
MKALKRIVKAEYQTTDGKVFSDKGEAATHQRELARLEELKALIKSGLTTGRTEPTDELTVELANFIVDHADKLRDILPKRAKSVEKDEALQTAA